MKLLAMAWRPFLALLAMNGIIILLGFMSQPNSVTPNPEFDIFSGFALYDAQAEHWRGFGTFQFYFNVLAVIVLVIMTISKVNNMKRPKDDSSQDYYEQEENLTEEEKEQVAIARNKAILEIALDDMIHSCDDTVEDIIWKQSESWERKWLSTVDKSYMQCATEASQVLLQIVAVQLRNTDHYEGLLLLFKNKYRIRRDRLEHLIRKSQEVFSNEHLPIRGVVFVDLVWDIYDSIKPHDSPRIPQKTEDIGSVSVREASFVNPALGLVLAETATDMIRRGNYAMDNPSAHPIVTIDRS